MLKKVITYKDFDGTERSEPFYFNLTKSELTEMELSTSGGYARMLQNIVDAQDGARILSIFKDILMKSYGEKSLDGKRFIKSKELSEAFSQTGAYDVLFMELVTDANKAAAFVKAIIPADVDLSGAPAAVESAIPVAVESAASK